ncbi:hypothetical protein D8674_038318 [Pyrus ussuriensis x Pyrus communis]|uniref:No apical meristem-associated C-terminal domain-containing protein n=1 Tax=Pyrus ussuriensis x Pyrus communis TaxID=2448454 RepID=A0A5N5I7T4_9ROSA|nr:hypothetical protein D8674_038318 [Pyrus ussuriensis x Pyrus communis]
MITSAMKGVLTRTSKKYYEFYEDTIPPNTRNNESCFSRWKKHLHPSLNKWHQALLRATSRHESGANYYDEVCQAEELFLEDNSKLFNHHGCSEICKGWVLFEDPPKQRVGPTPVFGNASSIADGDEDGSPPIQEICVENSSLGEGSIPRAMRRNKARKLKEKGKAKDDYAFQEEMAASLRLMAEQNAIAVEERNQEMDDMNMQRNNSDYTPMSKTYFDMKKRDIMARRELFTLDYNPTMTDDDDDDYKL